MILKKLFVTLFLLFSQVCFADIHSVTVGKMSGDDANSEFSIVCKLTADNNLSTWQFGFYMPRPFIKQQSYNPDLIMQICDDKNVCANLNYLKDEVIKKDQSAGYTTMLAPATTFPLTQGKSYTISLLHNNQWNAGNYSSLPQNFFLLGPNNQFYKLHTTKSTYNLLDYNQSAIDTAINAHVESNWNKSATKVSNNIIVPAPVKYRSLRKADEVNLTSTISIHNLLTANNTIARQYQDALIAINIKTSIDNATPSTSLANGQTSIILQKASPGTLRNKPEGYTILISKHKIIVRALNDTGAFYALQTLRQLWTQNPQKLPSVYIQDYPRFKYRGILLDTARHYFSVPEIENLIDIMASHKLNTLHIHFSDDEGFRLVLNDPKLNDLSVIGGNRGLGLMINGMLFLQGNLDTTNISGDAYPTIFDKYSGVYTRQDIQTLINYANFRKITIIPEIDIPGHARSLVKSLPDSFVDPNDKSQFVTVQGYNDDVIPVCTYNTNITVGPQFTNNMNAIVDDIAQEFNGQTTLYAVNNEVSIGGDEVSGDAWTTDASCQGDWASLNALAKAQKFLHLLANSNLSLNFSGWQQMVQTDTVKLGDDIIPASQTGHVYVWNLSTGPVNGIDQAVTLAENGYPTVLAFADLTYFDLAYTPDIKEPGFSWATQFSDTYAALSSALSATTTINKMRYPYKHNIVGIEGTLWGENLTNYNHMIYMALPKMAGLAEASWSPASITVKNKTQLDWKLLATRLGCGSSGFLNYLHQTFSTQQYPLVYRGYPNGIKEELPAGNTVCPH